jgi:hypothetical protein
MDLSKLDELKSQLAGATDFSKVWDFFFDHYGNNGAFLEVGQATENPLIQAAVEGIVEQVFQSKHAFFDFLVVEVAEKQFFHGCSLLDNGAMVSYLFFADINMGMAAVVKSLFGGETTFARFSVAPMKPGKTVFAKPPTRTLH